MQRKFMRRLSIVIVLLATYLIRMAISEQQSWDCPECGKTGNTGNYCGSCGHPSPWIVNAMIEDDEEIETEAQEAKLQPYKTIGNYVTFGTYPQTEEGTDQTPIEWLVLDYDEDKNKVLLISRYGLDVQPYNTENVDTTWKECTLRTWLNNTFLNKAINKDEQSVILLTYIDNSKGQGYNGWNTYGGWSTNGGNNTQDRIFLLSCAEVNHYFGADKDNNRNMISRVAPSTYAKKKGAIEYISKDYNIGRQ